MVKIMQDKGDFYYFCPRIEVTLDAMIDKSSIKSAY